MLVECIDKDYVFQIVCISGYHAGNIYGYVKTDNKAASRNVRGVSKGHLTKEIKRNFLFVKDSLKIIDEK